MSKYVFAQNSKDFYMVAQPTVCVGCSLTAFAKIHGRFIAFSANYLKVAAICIFCRSNTPEAEFPGISKSRSDDAFAPVLVREYLYLHLQYI